jgi:SAM-dependent methyltransferase
MSQHSSDWFDDWFDEDYLALYEHRDLAEARRFVSVLWSALDLAPGVRVADVPCGAGRHSLAFAERGARVAGVDLSPVMLKRAADECRECPRPPFFVRGDMRRVPLASGFQLVANIFSSIGYFEDEVRNRAAFSELVRLLAPGGVLVIDVIHPAFLRAHFVAEASRKLPDGEVHERRELDEARRRVIKQITIRRSNCERMIHESVRLYERAELSDMARACKLDPFAFWGDYNGAAFTSESPRLILLARNRSRPPLTF